MQTASERKKHNKFKNYGSLTIALLWITCMGVMGFMLPHIIGNSSIFRASKVIVYKNKYINSSYIENALSQLNWNWLLLTEGTLKRLLTEKVGNIIEDVDIDRDITSEGIIVKVKVKEKEPVAIVKKDSDVFLVDKKGNILPYIPKDDSYPVIYTNDMKLVKDNFHIIYSNIISNFDIREIYIDDNEVIVYLKSNNIKVLLSSAREIGENKIEMMKDILLEIYKKDLFNVIIDLRFSDFIRIKNISVMEGL